MSNRPFVIGLTGSIGMGKSTTGRMFHAAGIPVWDADAAVHKLYGTGGAAVAAIRAVAPAAVQDRHINRAFLSDAIEDDPALFEKIEAAVHPLVAADRMAFIEAAEAPIVVVDIPLLFETGAEDSVDAIVVVTTSAEEQRERVMGRDGMTDAKFATILAKQTPDAEKRERADYVIETTSMDAARAAVKSILREIKGKLPDA